MPAPAPRTDAPGPEAGSLAPHAAPPTRLSRLRRPLRKLTEFFAGQGSVQVINILTGLYLVRAMSIEGYAQYGLATSFQQLTGLLMDFGFAGTIIPLVGRRAADRAVIGLYVRSAKHLRDRAFLLLSPVAAIALLAIMHRHHWSLRVELLLLVSVLVSIWSTGNISYFSAPLVIEGRILRLYSLQAAVGAVRLAALALLRTLGTLSGWVAAAATAAGWAANATLLEKIARKRIEWPTHSDPATQREVVRYILPAVPAMIFAAFQVQSSVFLISIFGHTAGIAQVSALGRLSQVFALLTLLNAVLIEPYMARLAHAHVLRRYLLLTLLASAACAPFVLLAFLRPSIFLWLLGAKYRGLGGVVGWAMLAGALNYMQVLLWIMNRSRKWVFWRGTFLEIGLTLAIEILFVVLHGVRTTADAVYFSLAAAAGPLATHAYIAIYGFLRGPQEQTQEQT